MAAAETRTIPVRLPDDLLDRLDNMINQLGVGSRNSYMIRAIDEFVSKFELDQVLQPTAIR